MKKILRSLILMTLIFIPINIKAESYDYEITDYDVDIVVNENNVFDITEHIEVYFNERRHGIYRNIPTNNTITRLDGTTSTNRAKVRNISVNEEYSTSLYSINGKSYKKLQIGDPDKTIIGEESYTIKYSYNIGKDPLEESDELYFNIIGDGWDDTEISGVDFTITMPKEFDEEKLGFSVGQVGSSDSSGIYYEVDGNTIEGTYYGTIKEGEALTVRLELPEGYFVDAGFQVGILEILMFVIPILFVLIGLFLWFKFGNDEKSIDTIEFYPPDNLNSLELAFCYKGEAEDNDITSLLVYLANKGYLKIQERESKSLFGTEKTFSLIKLKEYDGSNDIERQFFNGLFSRKNEVTELDLSNKFYITMDSIKRKVNSKTSKYKIFEKMSLTKKVPLIIMALIIFVIITVIPVAQYESVMLPIALIFPGIGFTVLVSLVKSKGIVTKIFGLVWGSMFGGVPWSMTMIPTFIETPFYIIPYLIGVACIITLIIIINIMPKRNKYGVEILGKIKGFKKFLEEAEKPKLEELVMQNPTYFYDILPYTYVLDVSNKWIEKFEGISYQAPDWYDSDSPFDIGSFGSFMNDTMSSARDSMSSSPSSSGGGGSSGGGSSGGGSGGGGGGSW